ncbi:MAG: nucleotide exchange factor GrpE [Isosphaeraceae bacterium]
MILPTTVTCNRCQARTAVRFELDLSRPIEAWSVECVGCKNSFDLPAARVVQLVEKRFATLQSKAEGQPAGTPKEQVTEFVRLAHELVRRDEAFAAWKSWVDTNPGAVPALKNLEKLSGAGLASGVPASTAPAAASFEDALTGSLGMIPKPLEDELKRIRTLVENLTRAFVQARGDQKTEVAAVQAVLDSALCKHPKEGAAPVPLRNVAAEVSRVVQQSAATLRNEFETHAREIRERLEQSPTPTLDVDVDLVARRLVDHLSGSDEAREVFSRVADAYFAPRHRDLQRILNGLPDLLDALERPLETWEDGTHLNEGQAAARDAVLEVLRQIHRKVDRWMLSHQIEVVPDPREESPPYDEKWHTRMGTEQTAEASKHETVQRVIRAGYRWAHGRVRKAEVVVSDYPGHDLYDVRAPSPAAESREPEPEPETAVAAGDLAGADGQAQQTPPDSHEHF